MQATLRFTDDDRDDQGFIKALLAQADAQSPTETAPAPPKPSPRRAAPKQAVKLQMSPFLKFAVGAAIGIALIAATMRGGAVVPPAAPFQQLVPTTAPAAEMATPISLLPTPTTGALLAYWAPDGGEVPGGIDPTAITSVVDVTPNGRWVRVEVEGGGAVWLLRSAWEPSADQLAAITRLARPTPAPAPAAPRQPTPVPQPPCASAGVPGKMVEVCGWGDLATEAQAKWLATYGGNPGIVTTPTPQEWNKP